MRVVVAVTGASGAVIARALLEELRRQKHEVHLIISEGARDIMKYEGVDASGLEGLASSLYKEDDLAAPISSSSFKVDAMVIAPCSLKTLSAVANGFSDNLVARAAENCLKMNWPLVVAPRDTPLSLSAIENMRKLKLAGALIVPPNMAYYYKPKTVDDATKFFAGKILDALGVDHGLYGKWEGA